jgi:RNA polymerase sigma-70 factor (ECF subfamily)
VVRGVDAAGDPLPWGRVRVTGPVSVEHFRGGRTLVVQDAAADPRFSEAERARRLEGHLRASVVVPLVKAGRWIAAFGVHCTAPRTWHDLHVRVVQDTAERALSRWSAFRPHSNLRAWLFTILRNLYVDQLRGRREFAVDDESAPWRNLEAPRSEVDGLVLRDVERALYCLTVEQREVLLLVGVEELSYSEAAAVLGVPAGTVMSRLSRAREHLRMLLAAGPAARPCTLTVVSNSR